MRLIAILLGLSFALSACFGTYAGDASYRVLNDPLRDYYYGTDGSPTDNDPTFIEGWYVDGS